MRVSTRCLAIALAAAALAPAAEAASIRVEAGSRTLLRARGLTPAPGSVTDAAGQAHPLDRPVALSLLLAAAAAKGVAVTCPWSASFGDCFPLGIGEPFAPGSSYYWRLVVDDRDSQVGAAQAPVSAASRVAFVATDFGAPQPPLLELRASARVVRSGGRLTVRVTAFDTAKGTSAPAAGALVTVGGQRRTTDASGTAVLRLTGSGRRTALATSVGATRSDAAPVCVFRRRRSACA